MASELSRRKRSDALPRLDLQKVTYEQGCTAAVAAAQPCLREALRAPRRPTVGEADGEQDRGKERDEPAEVARRGEQAVTHEGRPFEGGIRPLAPGST